MAEFRFPCTSQFLVESKSFKLYLNSFNQTRFADPVAVVAALKNDLAAACGAAVQLRLLPVAGGAADFGELPGRCLDDLDIAIDRYDYAPELLAGASCADIVVAETLHSHLLKSNCLVTRQPDWASILIRYHGPVIDHAALLRYLVSFRRHSEFHEQCVERIYRPAALLRPRKAHRLCPLHPARWPRHQSLPQQLRIRSGEPSPGEAVASSRLSAAPAKKCFRKPQINTDQHG